MGSDRKPMEEIKKSSKRNYSSASQDEGKGKRQRTGDEEERKSKKSSSSKKEERKDKKSHKHRSSDKEKKSRDKHKSKHHKVDRRPKDEIVELTKDDYFSKSNEFATWLKEEKNVFFSELSSESAREMFSSFIKAWNKGKLESRYYDGIKAGPRTAHNWKIKQ